MKVGLKVIEMVKVATAKRGKSDLEHEKSLSSAIRNFVRSCVYSHTQIFN